MRHARIAAITILVLSLSAGHALAEFYIEKGSTHNYLGDCGQGCTVTFGIFNSSDTLVTSASGGQGAWISLVWNVPTGSGYSVKCKCQGGTYDKTVMDDITVYEDECTLSLDVNEQGQAIAKTTFRFYASGGGTAELRVRSVPDDADSAMVTVASQQFVSGTEYTLSYNYVTGIIVTEDTSAVGDTSGITMAPSEPSPKNDESLFGSLLASCSPKPLAAGGGVVAKKILQEVTKKAAEEAATTVVKKTLEGQAPVSVICNPCPAVTSGAGGKQITLVTSANCAGTRWWTWWLKDPYGSSTLTAQPATTTYDNEDYDVYTGTMFWTCHPDMKDHDGWSAGPIRQAAITLSGRSMVINNHPGKTHGGAHWYPYDDHQWTKSMDGSGVVAYWGESPPRAAGDDLAVFATVNWP